MTYKNLNLKTSYESGVNDLVRDFYVPVLECSASYDRIAGFFSSSSLAIAARGIAGLIINRGKMRLLASPRLSAEDASVITSVTKESQIFFENLLINSISGLTSKFEQDHLQALGWMLANDYLEIRLVQVVDQNGIVQSSDLFHEKVGVLKDTEGNQLSFSGSINESASGWVNNIEEFKVFRKWIPGQEEFFQSDQNRFVDLWEGKRSNIKVSTLPRAVCEHLIEIGKGFSLECFIAKNYAKKHSKKSIEDNLALFPYQQKALSAWIENDYSLLFEMATGTGKTRTALACIYCAMRKEDHLVVVISCPQTTLARQWENNELRPAGFKFDLSIIADGTNTKWRKQLQVGLQKISTGFINNIVIYTTHLTCSCSDFTEKIMQCSKKIPLCFVGDEAHGLGAVKSQRALLEGYRYRIGLSATPQRWFDDYGTEVIQNYFGGKSFEFSIADALSTINPVTNLPFLVNYYYYPIFVTLTEDELELYQKLSKKIRKLSTYVKNSSEFQEHYEYLLFARANIQKNAVNKMPMLKKILLSMGTIKNTLIFVSPSQIDDTMQMLKDIGIIAHRFTEKQGTVNKSEFEGLTERQFLIEHFKKGNYQVLVAISCLNEGIDIPSANTAILMANSTNPREYVQRIGRVIRQAKGKKSALIYDFIVEPDKLSDLSPEIQSFEKQIFVREVRRAEEMSKNAINNAETQYSLDNKIWEAERYGIE